MGVASADLQLYLHRSLVRPILDFGAAVWGPRAVQGAQEGGSREAEDMHLQFLRQVFGVKKSVAGVVVLREAGEGPVWAGWIRRAAAFWNRVLKRGEADLVRSALEESWRMAEEGEQDCWVAHMRRAVGKVAAGLDLADHAGLATLTALPTTLTSAQRGEWWRLGLTSLDRQAIAQGLEVREVPAQRRDGFKVYTHHRWFAAPVDAEGTVGARFWQVLWSRAAVRRVAQLRMGSHRLAIEEGRFTGIPRAQRVCRVCEEGVREDERHYVFECAGYTQIRGRYPELFGGGDRMLGMRDDEVRAWMNPVVGQAATWWPKLNAFLLECTACRNASLGV